jgi:predicted kinase
MNKTLHILRGVSGSGKSTFAKTLNGAVCSADDFFFYDNGYHFDAKSLGKAHSWCLGKCEGLMLGNCPIIIIDNTNTQHWEYAKYVGLAKRHGYNIEIHVVGDLTSLEEYSKRNVHGVSLEIIKKQAERFEK